MKIPKDMILPSNRDKDKKDFYTNDGFLTPYALSCGYAQIRGDKLGVHARLELSGQDVLGTYKVSVRGRYTGSEGNSYHHTLTNARKVFCRINYQKIEEECKRIYLQKHIDRIKGKA